MAEITKDRIQQNIEVRALRRAHADYTAFIESIKKNPIARRLKFKVGADMVSILGNERSVFLQEYASNGQNKGARELTNIETVREELFNVYVQEESDSLFNKLEALSDYLANIPDGQ